MRNIRLFKPDFRPCIPFMKSGLNNLNQPLWSSGMTNVFAVRICAVSYPNSPVVRRRVWVWISATTLVPLSKGPNYSCLTKLGNTPHHMGLMVLHCIWRTMQIWLKSCSRTHLRQGVSSSCFADQKRKSVWCSQPLGNNTAMTLTLAFPLVYTFIFLSFR